MGWASEAQILERIRDGASLRQLGAEPGMPCARTLYAWMRRRPAFAEAILQACRERNAELDFRLWIESQRATSRNRREVEKALSPLAVRLARLRRLPGQGG